MVQEEFFYRVGFAEFESGLLWLLCGLFFAGGRWVGGEPGLEKVLPEVVWWGGEEGVECECEEGGRVEFQWSLRWMGVSTSGGGSLVWLAGPPPCGGS